ncbi:MAG: ROK family transcriptional regulator [Deltaproteobacteria bacterium]|nr:ROK family transcriptional regulator [Deltaproteobacteria bacterium]
MSTTSTSIAERRRSRSASRRPTEASTRRGGEALADRASLKLVLQLLWRERRISRAEIARRNDLSRSTVSEVAQALLDQRLVREVGTGESSGGRRPIVLEFRDDACFILGIDLGATHVSVALTDLRCRVLAWASEAHPVRTDPHGTRALLVALVDRVLGEVKEAERRLVGVGVAVPSPVDPRRPDHLSEIVLPAWHGRGVVGVLESRLGVPVLVDNDANVGALAESWWGAAQGVEDSAWVKLGTGVGSGHIIRGEIYRGATGVAGEIGHVAIDPQGPPCVCGLRGCLATFVGSDAVVDRVGALRAAFPGSKLAAREALSLQVIEDDALQGDPLALHVIGEVAEHLGTALAGAINLLNPAVVSVGGSLARVGAPLFGPLRDKVRARTLVTSASAAEIVPSALGDRGIAVGAATLVLQQALQRPQAFLSVGARRA